MAEIYQNAQTIIAWLGEKDSDSEDTIDFILRLLDPSFLSNDNWPSTYARGFYALASLLDRSWFSRIWILQEVAYIRNIVLNCGDYKVHFNNFMDTCNILKSKLDTIEYFLQNTPLYNSYRHLLHNFQDSSAGRLFDILRNIFIRSDTGKVVGKRLSLESLVFDLVPFQAIDPRDSVFALLGLAKDADILSSF
jgi:hypothetical protein